MIYYTGQNSLKECKLRCNFFIEESESYDWFEGIVQYYDKHTRKYAIYFSSKDRRDSFC